MSFLDIAAFAAVNLWRRKLRTMLTVLGVIIGTACIVIMVALGLGNLEQFQQTIMESADLTRIEIYPTGASQSDKITDAKLDQLRAIEGVKNVTGVMNIPAYILLGRYSSDTYVMAVDPEAMDFQYMEGGGFAQNTNVELVIGANARQYFEGPGGSAYSGGSMMYYGNGVMIEEEVGDSDGQTEINFAGESVKFYPGSRYEVEEAVATPENPKPKEYRGQITGVLAASDSQESYSIYMSIPAANRVIRENRRLMDNMGVKEGEYSQGYVNAVDVDAVEGVLNTLKELGYQAYSPTEWIAQMQEEGARQQSQLIAIGLISLFVSAIGIANTMLASILERSREIGVMKVVGLSISKINLMFLSESAMIGLIGGLIGLGISYIFGFIVNSGSGETSFLGMYFQNGVQLSIPWWLALGAVGIAVGVGIVSGIYPARKATKMSPLEAIRSTN